MSDDIAVGGPSLLPPLPDPSDPPAGQESWGTPPADDGTEVLRRRSGTVRQRIEQAEGDAGAQAVSREMQALAEFVEAFRAGNPNGHVEVQRIGPPDLPASEIGRVGKIKIADMKGKAPEEVIESRWGGGEYRVVVKRSNNSPVPDGVHEVAIAGDIIPKGRDGERWLERRNGRQPDPQKEASDSVLRMLAQRALEPPPAPPVRDEGSLITSMLAMQSQHFERWQRTEDSRQERSEREWNLARERERTLEEDRRQREEREYKDREKRNDAEWKLRVEEARRSAESSAAEQKMRYDLMLEEMRERSKRDQKLAELQAGGALGLDGLKKIRETVAELVGEKLIDGLGGGEGPPDDWGSTFRQMVSTHGGDLLGRFMEVVAEGRRGGAPAGPSASAVPMAAGNPAMRRLPRPKGPQPVEDDVEVEDFRPDAAAEGPGVGAPPPGTPPIHVMGGHAAVVAGASVRTFLRLVGSEIMAQASPARAWDRAQDDEGSTLADTYELMPKPHRVALARAATDGNVAGWRAFVSQVPPVAHPELKVVVELLQKHADAREWLTGLLDSGPWTWKDESPEDDEPDVGEGDEHQPPPEIVPPPDVPRGPKAPPASLEERRAKGHDGSALA